MRPGQRCQLGPGAASGTLVKDSHRHGHGSDAFTECLRSQPPGVALQAISAARASSWAAPTPPCRLWAAMRGSPGYFEQALTLCQKRRCQCSLFSNVPMVRNPLLFQMMALPSRPSARSTDKCALASSALIGRRPNSPERFCSGHARLCDSCMLPRLVSPRGLQRYFLGLALGAKFRGSGQENVFGSKSNGCNLAYSKVQAPWSPCGHPLRKLPGFSRSCSIS